MTVATTKPSLGYRELLEHMVVNGITGGTAGSVFRALTRAGVPCKYQQCARSLSYAHHAGYLKVLTDRKHYRDYRLDLERIRKELPHIYALMPAPPAEKTPQPLNVTPMPEKPKRPTVENDHDLQLLLQWVMEGALALYNKNHKARYISLVHSIAAPIHHFNADVESTDSD